MNLLEWAALASVTAYTLIGLVYVFTELRQIPSSEHGFLMVGFCVFMVIFWPWGVFEDNNKSWRVKR